MERQTILERLGWRFIRIRGSEYYRDPEKTMERVVTALEEMGLRPIGQRTTVHAESVLLQKVKNRAAEYVAEWEQHLAEEADDTIQK